MTEQGVALLDDLRRNGTTLINQALECLEDRERAAVLAALPALEKLADRVEATDFDAADAALPLSAGSL